MPDPPITPKTGLPVGTPAPSFAARDTDGVEIDLMNLARNHRGVLIDFFRGSW